MSKNTPAVFRVGAFSTNFDNFSPITIIRQFFVSTVCKNISYIKDNHVEFEHVLEDSTEIHTNFIAISNLEKSYNVCSCADCFIIFVDLELKESMDKLEQIVNYIKIKCNEEKKVYVLGIYTKGENIQSNFKEETFKDYLDTTKLYYEYLEVCLEVTVELVKIFEKIIKDAIEAKKELKILQSGMNEDMSGSGANCYIF